MESREKIRIKLKTRTPTLFSPPRTSLLSFSRRVGKFTRPSIPCTFIKARELFLKFQFVAPETAHLPTHRIAEIRNSRARRRQKYILGGFVVGLIVVPPERAARTVATAATAAATDQYRSADAGQ